MEINNQVYEAIRELILLAFFTESNFITETNRVNIGEYKYKDKKYEIHSSWSSEIDLSIFIKCEDHSIHLIVEDDEKSRRFNGPVTNDVYLHINEYKNIDFKDACYLSLLKYVDKKNIIFKSKIKLDYSLSLYMCTNPNGLGPCSVSGKKFIFNEQEYFDETLKNKKCIRIFKDEFSPEIILNLINQIYPNFNQIHINNKIDKIIKSLSQDELIALKERLQEKDKEKELQKTR